MYGKGRGVSVFLVLVVLAWFPSAVEGGRCSHSSINVKAANMGACKTCEASCSSNSICEYGCAAFFGDYPTLASCKAKCDVRPQMNRTQCNPAVWWFLCMPQTRCVGVGGWRGILMIVSNSHTPCLRWRTALNGHIWYCVTMSILNHLCSTLH